MIPLNPLTNPCAHLHFLTWKRKSRISLTEKLKVNNMNIEYCKTWHAFELEHLAAQMVSGDYF